MDPTATTKTGAVDLLGALAGNYVLTNQASKSPELRWCWGDQNQPTSAWRDYRFGGGLVAAGVGMLSSGDTRRVAFGAASASLHSFVGTEGIRRAMLQRVAQQPQAYQQPQQPQAYQQVPGGYPQQPAFGPPVYPQQLPAPAPQFQQASFAPAFLPGTFR